MRKNMTLFLFSRSIEPYKYLINKDVEQKLPLNGIRGRFHEADWIPKKDPPIVLLVMNDAAEREASFYIQLSIHPHIIQTFGLVQNDRQSIILLQERATSWQFADSITK